MIRRRKVRLTYAGRAPEAAERLVDPWGLIDKDDVWYLLAGTDRGRRTFRVDRIVRAEPTDEPADHPDDFVLAAAWQEVVDEIERRRARTWATVLVRKRFAPILRDQFGRHGHIDGEPDGEPDGGRVRVRVAAPTPLDVARHLAGWGALVEVIEPRSVRHELARIGAELVDRYPAEEGARSLGTPVSAEGQ